MSAKYILKILTLGDQNVGKSSIILKYTEDKFIEEWKSTLAIDFKTKLIKKGNELIKLTIYDTAGQEKYRYLIKNYYSGSNGILLVFDITDRNSFQNLNDWLVELENNSDLNNLFIYLIGNKNDLQEKRQVTYEEANSFAKSKNIPYIEISAKTGDNIQKLFDGLIKGTIMNIIEHKKNDKSFLKESVRISFLDKEEKTVKSNRCC